MIDLIIETAIFLFGIWFGFKIAINGKEETEEEKKL